MLILLRHGRTPNNAEARLQGQFDSPLDEVGRAQATHAGAYIRGRWDIDRVVTSSLARTTQTAACAGFGDHPTDVDDRWQEIQFGTYDLRRIRDVMVELGAAWRNDIAYEPPGGESMVDMYDRVARACDELVGDASERDLLVVTHATPIKAAVVWALGGDASMILRMRVHLGSVTAIEPHGDERLLVEYNRRLGAPHLDDPVAVSEE